MILNNAGELEMNISMLDLPYAGMSFGLICGWMTCIVIQVWNAWVKLSAAYAQLHIIATYVLIACVVSMIMQITTMIYVYVHSIVDVYSLLVVFIMSPIGCILIMHSLVDFSKQWKVGQ